MTRIVNQENKAAYARVLSIFNDMTFQPDMLAIAIGIIEPDLLPGFDVDRMVSIQHLMNEKLVWIRRGRNHNLELPYEATPVAMDLAKQQEPLPTDLLLSTYQILSEKCNGWDRKDMNPFAVAVVALNKKITALQESLTS